MSMKGSTIGTLAGAILGVGIAIATAGAGTPITFGLISMGASLGAAVGGTIGGLVDYMTAADQVNRQDSIAELQIQTSSYGSPIPQLIDTHRLAGNIFFASLKKEHQHRQTAGGGKGGGPKQVSITKTYSIDLGIGLCDTLVTGPMTQLVRAWADGTLIYDAAQFLTFPRGWTFYPGTDTQPIDPTMAHYHTPEFTPQYIYTCYLVMADYDMGPYPRVPNFTFEVTQGERLLPDVVQMLALAAGVPAGSLRLTDLPARRVRLLLNQVQPVRGILEQLMVAFRFYLRESGTQLDGRSLGTGDVVADIAEGDLDAMERAGQTQGLQIARERARMLPTQVHVAYTAPSRDYQQATQMATIGTLETVESPRAVSTSVALEDADAKALAQENLDRVWIERTQYALEVSRRHGALEPGDRVRVTSRGYTHTLLLTEAYYGRPGLMVLKGKGDSVPVFDVPGAPPGLGDFPDTILAFLEQTVAVFLDLPALDSGDQGPRYHVVYFYPAESWPGAALLRSQDGGASYDAVHAGALQVIGGTATTVLPDAPAHLTDTTSTLEVHLDYGQIVSLTPEAFQAGGNLAMLGSELIQFREAELIAEGTYVLRHFWRGRRGTEWATGTHASGERFTWMDRAVYRVETELAERYVPRQWKAVTQGLDVSTATAQTYAVPSENLKPWSVASYHQRRQANDDWVLAWRGRARFTGAWIDGSEASPDPDFLTYRVTIYSDGTYATAVRTLDQADSGDWQAVQVYTYTSSDQTADFGAPQTVLYARVLQVGRLDVSRPQAA